MSYMQLQIHPKGATYSADCAKCGSSIYTHEWANDDHNERRDVKTYRVFRRTAANWEQFAKARKTTQKRGLTYGEAQRCCERYNAERTSAQIRAGTKFEFEQEYKA